MRTVYIILLEIGVLGKESKDVAVSQKMLC